MVRPDEIPPAPSRLTSRGFIHRHTKVAPPAARIRFGQPSSPRLCADLGQAGSLAVGLTFGLALVALIYTFGHISGCHLNPAVTVGLALSGKFPWKYTPYYLISQMLGAITASLAVWGIFGEAARIEAILGAAQPTAHAPGLTVFVIEAVMTFFLVLVICSVATDKRAHPAIAGIAAGFTLAVCVLVAGPVSDGAITRPAPWAR
jgi:glycerol uptake facilitator-like aquaporin